jgi:hypothetical protein
MLLALSRDLSDFTLAELLEVAISVELATIPPYLTGLLSLVRPKNPDAFARLHDIMFDEMTHLTRVANILSSIGESPKLSDRVPTYPGPLPFDAGVGVIVHLRRCSLDQIQNVYMQIEQPEHPIPPTFDFALSKPTIGQFYAQVKAKIAEFTGAFTNRNQIAYCRAELVAVTSKDDALKSVETIAEQGEGTPANRCFGTAVSHYYHFQELVIGHTLECVAGQITHGTTPVRFDPTGVTPLVDDPTDALYKPGTQAHDLSEAFNGTFSKLIVALEHAFNNRGTMRDAINLMRDLDGQGIALMKVPFDGTTFCSPTYTFTAPKG